MLQTVVNWSYKSGLCDHDRLDSKNYVKFLTATQSCFGSARIARTALKPILRGLPQEGSKGEI